MMSLVIDYSYHVVAEDAGEELRAKASPLNRY